MKPNKNLSWRYRRVCYLLRQTSGSIALRGWRCTLARMQQVFQLPGPTLDDALPLMSLNTSCLAFALLAPITLQVVTPVGWNLTYMLAFLRSPLRHDVHASLSSKSLTRRGQSADR